MIVIVKLNNDISILLVVKYKLITLLMLQKNKNEASVIVLIIKFFLGFTTCEKT